MTESRIVILGAGPAGLGAAWQLRVQGKADALVLEQRDEVGGNAGSFQIGEMWVDYGSHRLHPACDPRILDDLRGLLGRDLLYRTRHGRIRLQGRWIHFPLQPLDLMFRLPPSFAWGVALDAVRKGIGQANRNEKETFANVLERGLGKTICHKFYFPYAEKIWGVPPDRLSVMQARRRVSAGSLSQMFLKVLRAVPGFRRPGTGRFYYPRNGYGQISRAIASRARELGARIQLNTRVVRVRLGKPHRIDVQRAGRTSSIEADHLWSTIPITRLAQLLEPRAAPDVLDASARLDYRAMVLVYLVLEQPQFTPYDAHYIPEPGIRITRLSEPKNYSGNTEPTDRTVLCAELPCSVSDDLWNATDDELGRLVRDALAQIGLPIEVPVRGVIVKRLSNAYPIYHDGYEPRFSRLDEWALSLGLLSFGRQGLFAHDNTHHALAMAYAAVECVNKSGMFDYRIWDSYRQEFTSHVVED